MTDSFVREAIVINLEPKIGICCIRFQALYLCHVHMNLLLYSLNGNVPYSIDATVVAYWIGTNKVNVRMYAPMVITSTTGRGTSKMSSFSRFSIGNYHLPIDVERQYNSFINIDPSIFEYGWKLLGLFIHFLLLNQKCTSISFATISIIFQTTYFVWLIALINY